MSSYEEDFEKLLSLAADEHWEISKVKAADGLVEDMGRNFALSLTKSDVEFLQKRGYSIEGPGMYEFIAPETSSMIGCFKESNETVPNIYSDDAES